MRRELRRVRHWIRGLVLAAIAMLGLVDIVGSGGGGGSLWPEPPEPCNVDCPLPQTVTVKPPYITALVGAPVAFVAKVVYPIDAGSYQWSRSDDGGNSYVNITGATGSSYSIAAVNLGDDGAMFKVQVGGRVQWRGGRLAVSATPGLVFEDREFQPADWIVSPAVGPSGISPGHSEERAVSGGNPGAYRKMVFTVLQPVDPRTGACVACVSLSSTYDPAAQGAILVVDYVQDCIALQRNGFGSMNTWSDL